MKSLIGKMPDLPRGLEYDWVTEECAMCPNCGSLVAQGMPMVRLSQRRKSRTFSRYFPMEEGICVDCTSTQFGVLVAEAYNKAEQQLNIQSDLEMKPDLTDEEKMALKECEIGLGAITEFMDRISEVMAATDEHDIEYIHKGDYNIYTDDIDSGREVREEDYDDKEVDDV